MASRRVRLKGVLNIPARRKPNAADVKDEVSDVVSPPQSEKPNDESNLTFAKESHVDQTAVAINNDIPEDATPEKLPEIVDTVASDDIDAQKSSKANKPDSSTAEKVPENVNVPPPRPSVEESTPLTVMIPPTPPVVLSQKDPKCISDTEYPPPPVSPSKLLNRRIKAVPRLHQRRPSISIGSASESEDDSRRTFSRVRNDSVCSVASVATDSQPIREAQSPIRKDPPRDGQQRKFRRTDHGRRLAEAKRNFYQKLRLANGKPDKQKLTMMDLIYYNPATNPMNPRKRKVTSNSSVSEEVIEQLHEEQKEDDPESDESDVDSLAPQIKVGPNGEIVIDEKSLVVENSAVKKGRKALEQAEVIDGDNDTSYGIYKRSKRSKDWSNEETIRFYKALNTIGTDFTMMGELFPNRTRRELKLKFKKEERNNRALVDRAVMQPVEFNMAELKRDLEEFERVTNERKARVEEVKLAKERQRRLRQEKRESKIDIGEYEITPKITNEEPKKEKRPVTRKRKKNHPYDSIKKGIDSLLEDSDIESDEEYVPYKKDKDSNGDAVPQRSSRRISKKVIEESCEKENSVAEAENQNSKINEMEPGSLMIIPSKGPAGNVLYKVFMVTDEKRKHQIDLDQETVESLRKGGDGNGKVLNVQNIITISADAEINGGGEEIIKTSLEKCDVENHVEISKDSIIFPFEECPLSNGTNQNITISHDDNKMIIVTEDK